MNSYNYDSSNNPFAIALFPWMWDERGLGLSGSELHVYSAVYGAAYDERHVMAASCADLADALGLSKRSVITALNKLEDRGLIIQFLTRPSGNGGRRIRGFTVNMDAVDEAQEQTPRCWPDEYRHTVSKLNLRSRKQEPYGTKRRVYPFDEQAKSQGTRTASDKATRGVASASVARPQ